MADLIRALILVKTPLALFAFVSLIFLFAFRTQRVPELFFGLAGEKLTKERFAQLLHRFMWLGFSSFVLTCGVAVVGQILAYKTQAQPLSLNELRDELKNSTVSEDQKQAALKAYSESLALIQEHELAQAIEALQKSMEAIPTLSAQTTLAYLYQKQGDQENARKYATSAQALANLQGDSLAQVRLRQLSEGNENKAGTLGLVGDKTPFPAGGKSLEGAVGILPGLYIAPRDLRGGEFQYFKVRLKAGQTLRIDVRSPDTGGQADASIYDANGGLKKTDYAYGRSTLKTVQWTAEAEGLFYLSIGSPSGLNANSVFRVSIQ